jgi:hypothetical protein
MNWTLLLLATLVACNADLVSRAAAAQQAIADKSHCTAVGGKIKPNPWSDGKYPYLCTYPDKFDRRCQRQLDETAYYDIAQKKCVSELLCDIEGIC